jgi:glycosyltransferase involved in cell wall biosynthesis
MHPLEDEGLLPREVTVHLLPFANPHGYFLNVPWVRTLLRRVRPSFLHAHYASGYGTLAERAGFHPVVLSVWGSDVLVFPEKSPWRHRLVRRNLAAADLVAVTSEVLRRRVMELGVEQERIALTPFGIDCRVFRPVDRSASDREFVIGTVKSLEYVYGVDLLIRAFAQLKARYPMSRLRLVIAGKGSLETDLKSLAEELGIGGVTEFTGFVPHTEVPRLLRRFSVFVALSRRESFGVAVLEASATGLPVVVSDTDGFMETMRDGETGIMVPARYQEAAAALERLFLDPDLMRRLGVAGRRFVEREYDWQRSLDRMETAYDLLLTGVASDSQQIPKS